MTATARIMVGDCLEVMPTLPDNAVDLVFCSPPYEDARTYGIDFNLRGQDWVDWCVPRYMECLRVSKGLVAWVVEGKTRQFRYSCTPALLITDLHRAGVHLRKPPAFQRVGIPGSGGPDWLRNDWEFIVCATSGGKLLWSDNTAMGHPPKWAPGGALSHRHADGRRKNESDGPKAKARRVARITRPPNSSGGYHEQGYTVPSKANPGNVIECIVGGGVMGSKLCHENEAPFPESLAEFFILSYCPPGGTVLDPFSGSGTTASVAVKNDRNAIAIDIRESQVELTNKRLADSTTLFAGAGP